MTHIKPRSYAAQRNSDHLLPRRRVFISVSFRYGLRSGYDGHLGRVPRCRLYNASMFSLYLSVVEKKFHIIATAVYSYRLLQR